MNDKEIKEMLGSLSKDELRIIISLAEEQLNSTLGIGDEVIFTIEYMIGDADGYEEYECDIYIETEDDLNAITIIKDILDNHTTPKEGHWGFSLDEESFSKKPTDVFNLLYNQEEAPEMFNGIKITPKVLETISIIVDETFRSYFKYSFLTFRHYRIDQ